MPIFTQPDATKYPDNFQSISDPDLEQKTGADMVIASVPLPPSNNLALHINNRSLFVQIKIGYDICSFDQLHSAIARMQEKRIPKGQAILLPIGEYWEDENGLLRLKGQKAFGTTQYSTLGTIFDMWSMRGGTVEALYPKAINDLEKWIERKQNSLQKIQSEGKRDIYPPSPQFIPEDIWQQVEEIDDWRKFLVSGLTGFGSSKANAVWQYARELNEASPCGFYHVLCLMTDEDESGKPVHNISQWGNKSRKAFRKQLGIPDGYNLSELSYLLAFYQGWQSFGNEMIYLCNKKGMSPKEAVERLQKEKQNMFELESQIPF